MFHVCWLFGCLCFAGLSLLVVVLLVVVCLFALFDRLLCLFVCFDCCWFVVIVTLKHVRQQI